jgi:hypothetical protein
MRCGSKAAVALSEPTAKFELAGSTTGIGIGRGGELDRVRRFGRSGGFGIGLLHVLGLFGIGEGQDVDRVAAGRIGDEVEQVGVSVGDHGHVGRRALGERLHEQQVGALVRGHLPLERIADGDVLDVLVLAEADRRLHPGLAFDADDLVRVVEALDEARVLGGRRGGDRTRCEQRCGDQGTGHFSFSRARADGARKRLPMPRARDSGELAVGPGARHGEGTGDDLGRAAPAVGERARVVRGGRSGAREPDVARGRRRGGTRLRGGGCDRGRRCQQRARLAASRAGIAFENNRAGDAEHRPSGDHRSPPPLSTRTIRRRAPPRS